MLHLCFCVQTYELIVLPLLNYNFEILWNKCHFAYFVLKLCTKIWLRSKFISFLILPVSHFRDIYKFLLMTLPANNTPMFADWIFSSHSYIPHITACKAFSYTVIDRSEHESLFTVYWSWTEITLWWSQALSLCCTMTVELCKPLLGDWTNCTESCAQDFIYK